MRARWQVEKLFDLWKRHGLLEETRSRKPWRVLCEVYAKLLGLLVQHWIFLRAARPLSGPIPLPQPGEGGTDGQAKGARPSGRPGRAGATLEGAEDHSALPGGGVPGGKRRKEPGTAQQLLALTDTGEEAVIA